MRVADDLDRLDGAEGPEQLPEDGLVGLGTQVIYKDAPARVVDGAQRRVADAGRWRRSVQGHSLKNERSLFMSLFGTFVLASFF